jgi:uncharacterized BrkB/YihY/UPF0761 family membrane protein
MNVMAIIPICIVSLAMAAVPASDQHNAGTAIGNKLRSHVEQDVLRKLKPYFPKAKTKLDQKGTLIILTCTRNLGPVMLRRFSRKLRISFIQPVYWRK